MGEAQAAARPRVSVVIPAYNRARLIRESVASILGQTLTDLELIVVDDGSTDGTGDIVRAMPDPRVRVLTHAVNRGMAAARNTGLDDARGVYVANLDSDDRAHPERLARQVAFLDAHPDHAMVGSWITYIEEDGSATDIVKRRPVHAADVHVQLLFGGGMTAPTMTGRAEVLKEFRYSETFTVRQDYDMLVRVAEHHKVANLPNVLHFHRRHAGQVTETKIDRLAAATKQIVAHQIACLGLDATPENVDRHYALPRLSKPKLRRQGTAVAADRAYLDWAEGWLRGLAAANRDKGIYDPRALDHLLGWFWFRTAFKVSRAEGMGVWRAFWGSPLARLTPSGLAVRLRRSTAAPGS
jgi:glycosyltransferase involved in cell wall biosynthesis